MISVAKIQSILNDQDPLNLERLAQKSKTITRQYFGQTISLYTPLYLSNYCNSHCVYCGFNTQHKITRHKLSAEEMKEEMQAIFKTGIQNILLLTGESPSATPLSYLKEAITIAKEFFPHIALEIYPLKTEEYKELFKAGADGLTIYQETYDRELYPKLHLAGEKMNYQFRYDTPARAAKAGMRHISLGILLGLGPLAEDLHALYGHLRDMEINYPGVEYSLSFPRLRTINKEMFYGEKIDDKTFVKVLCLTRTLFPRVGLNLSTRESQAMRNHALRLGVTRLSAGSKTCVGGYSEKEEPSAPQFDVDDTRDLNEMIAYLKEQRFDPILTDWRRIS